MIVNPTVSRKVSEIKQCYFVVSDFTCNSKLFAVPIVFENGMTWLDWIKSPYYTAWQSYSNGELQREQQLATRVSSDWILYFDSENVDDPLNASGYGAVLTTYDEKEDIQTQNTVILAGVIYHPHYV